MADFFLSVEQQFGAGHVLPDDPDCRFVHGHLWIIRVTVQGIMDLATGSSAKAHELTEALGLVVAEVEGKSFNEMVPQTKPTLEGVGLWIIDRLVKSFPRIVRVDVEWPDLRRSCSIARQLR
jgi:6-pyruvoyl-tetrahydropterin synthase